MEIFPKKAKFGQIASSPRLDNPNLQIFLHEYIRHIRDTSQLCLDVKKKKLLQMSVWLDYTGNVFERFSLHYLQNILIAPLKTCYKWVKFTFTCQLHFSQSVKRISLSLSSIDG